MELVLHGHGLHGRNSSNDVSYDASGVEVTASTEKDVGDATASVMREIARLQGTVKPDISLASAMNTSIAAKFPSINASLRRNVMHSLTRRIVHECGAELTDLSLWYFDDVRGLTAVTPVGDLSISSAIVRPSRQSIHQE